tara:strand:- start:379 stop:1773 length:1395 start_codon:yes stop_codon:yes gene_type:complete
MGRKLSFTGLAGSGGGGGGGASGGIYNGTFLLDTQSYDGQNENKNFSVTNMDSYFQTFRIRGLDTSTKAYSGWNSMMRNSTGTSGTMQHVCGLISANQTTGAITKEQITVMHNNPSSNSDYSTFTSCGDEWTGRYSYSGHCPRQGSNHTYGYDCCFLYSSNGSKDSYHQNSSTYIPNGNRRNSSAYVNVSERKLGGEVRHTLSMYNTSGYATAVEFHYGDSTSSLSGQSYNNGVTSKSGTSTNNMVQFFSQWDTSYTEPFYTAFHSFQEGMTGRRRSNNSWYDLPSMSDYPRSNDWMAWIMSNGNTLLTNGSSHFKFDTSGNRTVISSSAVKAIPLSVMLYNYQEQAYNIGQDEWFSVLPDMKAIKFKFDPNTMVVTKSNALEVADISGASYANRHNYQTGFWSRFSVTSVNSGGTSATYGTENSLGNGFGQSNILYVGGDSEGYVARAATFAIKDLCDTLSYS